MRDKKQVETEFNQVKNQLKQAQQVVFNCQNRMSELRGQFQLLKIIESEKKSGDNKLSKKNYKRQKEVKKSPIGK